MADKLVNYTLIRNGVIEKREYQDNIVKTGLIENTLVVLPTGLGKTIIAAMVAAERLKYFPEGKILILAPTKPLVQQHYERFKEFLNLEKEKFQILTGAVYPERRKKIWTSGKIFFLTPQILENDLISERINLEDFVLAVFDEGHRAVGNYPYVFIAEQYMRIARNPRIIGLTASPGYTKEDIEKIKKNLFVTAIEARNDSSKDVSGYIKSARVEWRKIPLSGYFLEVRDLLVEVANSKLKLLKDKEYLTVKSRFRPNLKELLSVKDRIQLEMSQQTRVQDETIQLMKNAMSAIHILHSLELLEVQGFVAAKLYFDRMMEKAKRAGSTNYLKLLFFDERIQKAYQIIQEKVKEDFDHPKVETLLNILKFELTENKVRRIIVFTNYRDAARRLAEKINKIETGLATWFIGQTNRPHDEGLSQKDQLNVLSAFRKGLYKVLVATQVAEEGLDISECDLVIFYDNVPSAIRFIQRRGRTGRKELGRVVILMAEKTKDEAYYWIARSKEKKMRETLAKMENKTKKNEESKLDFFLDKRKITEKKITIHVDNRESPSLIARELMNLGVNIELSNLPVADYILSDRVAVERKNVNDLVSSIIDKRLFDQLKTLKESYGIPLLLIEGNELYATRGMHPDAIRGAIASVIVNYGIPIIWTKNQIESAQMLYTIAKREQTEREIRIIIRGEKKPLTIDELQEFIIAGLPNIDAVLAKRLLEYFGSVEKIFTASKEQLMEVAGIGEKIAEKIRLIASHKYGKENPTSF